jgi:hypothetical protein
MFTGTLCVCSASQFDVFHELLAQYRAGDLALRIVEYEHNRHKFRRDVRAPTMLLSRLGGPLPHECVLRLQELDKLTQLADAQARGDKELEAKIRNSVADVAAKGALPIALSQRSALNVCALPVCYSCCCQEG